MPLPCAMQISQPLTPLVDEFAGRLFGELDYVQEGQNCERFAELYGHVPRVRTPGGACNAFATAKHWAGIELFPTQPVLKCFASSLQPVLGHNIATSSRHVLAPTWPLPVPQQPEEFAHVAQCAAELAPNIQGFEMQLSSQLGGACTASDEWGP